MLTIAEIGVMKRNMRQTFCSIYSYYIVLKNIVCNRSRTYYVDISVVSCDITIRNNFEKPNERFLSQNVVFALLPGFKLDKKCKIGLREAERLSPG